MKLGWKRPAEPAPTPSADAPPAEPERHGFVPRVSRRRYWIRSTLWTAKSVVCAQCGQRLGASRFVHY